MTVNVQVLAERQFSHVVPWADVKLAITTLKPHRSISVLFITLIKCMLRLAFIFHGEVFYINEMYLI